MNYVKRCQVNADFAAENEAWQSFILNITGTIKSELWIRIHNVIKSGSNPDLDTDPDPQHYFKRPIFSKTKNQHKKSKILAVFTIFKPFRYKNKFCCP
jgi:hypothetical protein